MANSTLETSVERLRAAFGPLSSQVVADCRTHLETLVRAPASEEWLAALHREGPANQELYRDPARGFVLLAHTESQGLYRPPHDHGRGWVIYALQQGEVEMGTYARVEGPDGVHLVKRDATLMRPGQALVYLPGDIHDTRCITGPALMLRFTERDLKREDTEAHRVTRYVERNGVWTLGMR